MHFSINNCSADIIEDQHVSLSVFTTTFEDTKYENDIKDLKNRDKGFKELNRMIERLEEKTESFHFQFMVIQQEASTQKNQSINNNSSNICSLNIYCWSIWYEL